VNLGIIKETLVVKLLSWGAYGMGGLRHGGLADYNENFSSKPFGQINLRVGVFMIVID